MRSNGQTLRPAIQTTFDHGRLAAVCGWVVAWLSDQDAPQKIVSNFIKLRSNDSIERKPLSPRPNHRGRQPGGLPDHADHSLPPRTAPGTGLEGATGWSGQPVPAVAQRQVLDLPPIKAVLAAALARFAPLEEFGGEFWQSLALLQPTAGLWDRMATIKQWTA